MKKGDALCPVCGSVLIPYEQYDEDSRGGKYYAYYVGVCPECNQNYNWREIHTYEGYDNVEKVEKNA